MKTTTFISAMVLAILMGANVAYADEAVATDNGVIGNLTGVIKKTVGGVEKVISKSLKLSPSTESTGEGEVAEDVVDKKVAKVDVKMKTEKSSNDDSKDAEADRKVSDTSITVFSQNPYIQSIMENTTHIKSARLKELVARGDKITMLDIRPRSEFAKTPGIKGVTLNIPRNFLEVEAYERLPNKNAAIVIISTKGIRGGLAANTLQNMGYTNVRNLMDGLQGWNKAK
jgi:rhodanese-related sulfurtransferase